VNAQKSPPSTLTLSRRRQIPVSSLTTSVTVPQVPPPAVTRPPGCRLIRLTVRRAAGQPRQTFVTLRDRLRLLGCDRMGDVDGKSVVQWRYWSFRRPGAEAIKCPPPEKSSRGSDPNIPIFGYASGLLADSANCIKLTFW